MHLGFLHGKPIVAYHDIEEAKRVHSCLTCRRYKDDVPCQYYGDCRAEKQPDDFPLFYTTASDELIESRLTIINGDIKWI